MSKSTSVKCKCLSKYHTIYNYPGMFVGSTSVYSQSSCIQVGVYILHILYPDIVSTLWLHIMYLFSLPVISRERSLP